MEELDIKWQMAMLSLRINKFQKKAGRKINFNKDSAKFNRRKERCYNYLQLGHFARECNVKKHEAENKTEEGEQVYGLMVGFKSDFADHVGNVAGSVYNAAAKFAMMGISPKVQTCPFGCDSQLSELKKNYEHLQKLYNDSFIQVQAYKNTVKTLELQKDWYHKTQLALEEKVRILSANLENTTNTLKYSETLYDQAKIKKKEWEVKFVESLARTKLGLGFKEYIGSYEVCDLSTPSVFDHEPKNREVKSLYESDKSSASKTYDFASCVSSPKTNDSFSTVDVKILPKSDVKDPSPTNGFPSCSFKENVKPPMNLCNKSGKADRIHCKNNFVRTKKCFVYGSKSHLIKDCDVYDTVDNFPFVISKAASVPAGSRNSSASTSAGRSIPAASRNRPASIHAGRHIPAGSRNSSASTSAGRSIPAASRNRPASIHAGRHIPAGRFNKSAPFLLVHPYVNKDIGIVDSGCSRNMTGNKEKLDDFVQIKGVLIKEFQLPDESQVVLRIPRRHDLYTFNLSDIQQVQQINYLLSKASLEESTKWHRRMAHVNFKTINKLAKHGLVEVTILNTSDHLVKFDEKANDGFLVGYAANSKAYRVYNLSSKKVEKTLNLRYLEDKPNIQGLDQEWYFDLDYLTDSLGYTRFKTNPPAGIQDINIITGPKVNDVSIPIENNLDYAEELARLQKQEHEAHSAAAKYGFEFSNETAEMLHQADIITCRNLVLAAGDPAGSSVSTSGVPAGSVPAGSIPASSVPAGSVPARSIRTSNVPAGGVLAGSIASAGFGDPAASESVLIVFNPAYAADSTLPPGHSLGSSEHSTRFPSPSDLGNHQPTAGIFSSSSYDDDFYADVTNLALSVVVDPVATKRVNTIHPQSQIIG
uniref:Ribonuclease H-like domain-containing protein n=1 Tax=Tanacetum cinerariifolium TaxID=118510 RepID=A0A6L2LP08_TANCI|nr:ribonuclease H-like domain-containing protein [Tanacetum cinerariifolium]